MGGLGEHSTEKISEIECLGDPHIIINGSKKVSKIINFSLKVNEIWEIYMEASVFPNGISSGVMGTGSQTSSYEGIISYILPGT